VDFRAEASLGVFMDDTKSEQEVLAAALLLEAGRLMEDSSLEFALAMPDTNAIADRVVLLERIAGDLHAFAAAALALLRASTRS